MMNCIVGLKIYLKYLSSLVLNVCLSWSNWPYMTSTVPFVWNLTYFSIIVQLVQIIWWRTLVLVFVNITSTVPFVWNLSCFSHYCSTCSNYVTLPQMVKNFNICKHNVYCSFCMELDLLHYIWCEILVWDTPWILTWM